MKKKLDLNMDKQPTIKFEPGLSGMLFITFLVLKLVPGNPVNGWSWWWVTAPLWIPVILTLVIFAIIFLILIISRVTDGK